MSPHHAIIIQLLILIVKRVYPEIGIVPSPHIPPGLIVDEANMLLRTSGHMSV